MPNIIRADAFVEREGCDWAWQGPPIRRESDEVPSPGCRESRGGCGLSLDRTNRRDKNTEKRLAAGVVSGLFRASGPSAARKDAA
jgi:hypothetical protein